MIPEISNFETEMNRGFLSILVLALLEKDMYGYAMVRTIGDLGYEVEENTLYPLLRRLEKNGWIKSKWNVGEDRPRKFYSLTDAGRALRAELLGIWKKQEEILSEIKSHILEKAEQEHGEVTETSLDKVIAAYGPARRVAEKYLDGHSIIAPAFKRHLFRYTSFLFAVHFLITAVAVIFTKSFLVFPFLYVPRMGVFEALFYLPTAFLFDLGLVTLILYFITIGVVVDFIKSLVLSGRKNEKPSISRR